MPELRRTAGHRGESVPLVLGVAVMTDLLAGLACIVGAIGYARLCEWGRWRR